MHESLLFAEEELVDVLLQEGLHLEGEGFLLFGGLAGEGEYFSVVAHSISIYIPRESNVAD
jgi:hypothetical protein